VASRQAVVGARPLRALRAPQTRIVAIFLAPTLLFFLVFYYVPIALELWSSLFDGQPLVGKSQFVGLSNYAHALADPTVRESVGLTLTYLICVTVATTVIALGLALILNQKLPLRNLFRSAIFFPYITTLVIVATIWTIMLDPYLGIVNRVLEAAGLPTQTWLLNPNVALLAVILVTVWRDIGYAMVLFLAGLQGIPPEYEEVARVDGAGAWARFRHVTLPLLAPTTLYVTTVTVVGAIQAFVQPYVMTGGGPAGSTRLYGLLIYQVGFSQLSLGYASALATILLAIGVVIGVAVQLISRREAEY
jgi:multiple sugar transport system permease protein